MSKNSSLYAVALFGLAVTVLCIAVFNGEYVLLPPWQLLFFWALGLATIVSGYDRQQAGYVSFDRIGQVASVLVLGPLAGAVVNALASLTFPWLRFLLERRRAQRRVSHAFFAALHNAGLMGLMSWLAGTAYLAVGGQMPLTEFELRDVLPILCLLLSMQVINELLMALDNRIGGGSEAWSVNPFVIGVELGAALCGVLVALVWQRSEWPLIVLMLTVLALGLTALTQFARMRTRLEELVKERTLQLQEQAVELEQQARSDQLTGLYNRRSAEEFLADGIAGFRERSQPFTIALLDIDHFKQINDHHSHQVGDVVLREVADLMRAHCRSQDKVARFGGEEFLVVFADASAVEAGRACEKVRAAIEAFDWLTVAPGLAVTLCAGVAEMQEDMDRSRLLRAADERLYAAKADGRNRVVYE